MVLRNAIIVDLRKSLAHMLYTKGEFSLGFSNQWDEKHTFAWIVSTPCISFAEKIERRLAKKHRRFWTDIKDTLCH